MIESVRRRSTFGGGRIELLELHLFQAVRRRNRTVISDAGASDDVVDATLKLVDEASTPLPDQVQLVVGTFKPRNYEGGEEFPGTDDAAVSGNSALSGFDGRNPNGTWKLRVVDEANGDCGEFGGGWTLVIKASVPTN